MADQAHRHEAGVMRPKSPVFVIRLRARPGSDGIRSLRAILKTLLRRHRLVCVDAREERSTA
jgi:hypothetical protein